MNGILNKIGILELKFMIYKLGFKISQEFKKNIKDIRGERGLKKYDFLWPKRGI